MTIVQLEYLLAVANCGSFSLASEQCFVTQPSLSTQIKNLEDELGVILLNRQDKPITLTDAGRVVFEQAQKAISSFHTISERVSELKNEVKGVFRVAVIPTIAPYMLHRFVPYFVRKYPDVTLEIREMFTRDIEQELKSGKIDLGILANGFTNPADISEEILFTDKLYLYHSLESPLSQMREIHIGDIDVDTLITLPDGHCLRTQVLDLCNAKSKSKGNLSFESGSLETIIRMVDSVGGTTILPAMAVAQLSEYRQKQIKPFSPIIVAQRQISLAVGKGFYKYSIYKAFKEQILLHK